MATEKDPCRVMLTDVRLSYPNVFKPKSFGKGEGKPAYSAAFLIDKDTKLGKRNIDKIEDAIEAAKDAEWKDKHPKIKSMNIAFRDGDDPDNDAPETEGTMILAARNYKRPKVLDRDKSELVEEDDVIYGGCYVDAVVRIWPQTYEGVARINCSLEAIRFRRDGDRFGAAPFDPDEFDDLDDEDEDEAPRSRRRSSRDDEDEDEDEAPRSRRRSSRDDDDEDEAPRSRRRNRDDDEDEDETPRSRRRPSRDDDEDEDEDEAPRSRRRSSRDDEDEAPRSRRRPSRDDVDDEDRPSTKSRRRNRDDDNGI